jgi:hypothetical protein
MIVACMLALGVLGAFHLRTYLDPPRLTGNDYIPDYVSAKAWREGGEPYAPVRDLVTRHVGPATPWFAEPPPSQPNAHTPFMIVLLAPLSFLPYPAARALFLALAAVLFVVVTGWSARAAGGRPAVAAGIGLAALALPVVQADLLLGQVNAILLLLLVVAWAALRDGADRRAGVALGIATALKIYPGLIVLALVAMRRFRAAAWHMGAAAVLSLAGAIAIGWTDAVRFARDVSSGNLRFWLPSYESDSLTAVPIRWLTPNAWFHHGIDLPVLAAILAAVAAALCLTGVLRSPHRVSGDAYWGALPWIMLAGPATWDHYLSLGIPFAIVCGARVPSLATRWRIAAVAGLALMLSAPALSIVVLKATGLAQSSVLGWVLAWALPLYGLIAVAAAEVRAR